MSEMMVWEKHSQESFVKQIPPHNKLLRFLWNRIMILSSRFGLDRLVGFGIWNLLKEKTFKNADIIHLQLIHNFTNFSIISLPFLSRKKPIVWTLHDLWPITGGCEHSFDCDKWQKSCAVPCPYPRATSFFQKTAPYIHWNLKKYLYSKSNMTLVVSSDWMLQRVKKSPLMKDFDCVKIPFGIDLKQFKLIDKENAKYALGIPADHKVIAFRDTGLKSDKFKGIKYIHESLDILNPTVPVTLIIFERGNDFNLFKHKYNIVKLGWVDQKELALALNATDVFLMPSLQESFGLMAVEAMACRTPVVTFSGTAIEEIVKDQVGGLVVPSKNSKALADAISYLIHNDNARIEMGLKAREIVEKKYNEDQYLEKHLNLYKNLCDQFYKTQ